MKQVNTYNFLRWFQTVDFIPTATDPAQGYLKDKPRCDYMPLLINGETLSFYINTLDGLNDIVQFPVTSNVAVISQGNTAANIFIFYLSGTPLYQTHADVTLTIDSGSPFTLYNSALLADDTLDKFLDRIVDNMAFLSSSAGTTVERYLTNGIKIIAPSTIVGDVVIDNITIGSDPKLKLVDAQTGQVINADIATLQQDTFVTEDGNNVFTFYASVSPSSIPPGTYFFRIGDADNNYLDSNQIIVPLDTNYNDYSCLCRFRHGRYYYGVNYQNLDDFYQQFRLHLNEIDAQYEQDKDVYNEVTTGKQRTYNNFKKKLRTLETYYFDKDAHDAAEIMFDSEEVYVNGKRYVQKATYKVSTNALSKTNKGSIDLYDQDFASANRCLTPIANTGGSCVAVAFPAYNLPNGVMGTPYNYSITLTGDQPFQLSDITKPTWMSIGISGNDIVFTGTPNVSGTGIAVSFTISNCSDNSSADFADTLNVTCTSVTIPSFSLPDATVGILYNVTIPITGSAPFTLSAITKPSWLTTVQIVGNTVELSGTPLTGNVGTGVAISFTVNNCSGASDDYSDTINVSRPASNLTLVYLTGGFRTFQATLSTPIDAAVNITKIFSDGFETDDCSGSSIASAQFNNLTAFTIAAGIAGGSKAAEVETGDWTIAIRSDVYNAIVNGSSVVNGNVVVIGSYDVTIVISSCH